MTRLSQSDLHALLGLLGNLYEMRNLEGFRRAVIQTLPTLVRSELTSYNEVNVRAGRDTWIAEPEDDVTDQLRRVFEAHLREHPLIGHYVRTGDGRALKISDFLSSRQFRSLGLYHEFYRRLGVEHQMAVTLPTRAPLVIGIALNRHRPDFSERDRLCLNLLRPHLVQAYRNAAVVTALEREIALLTQGMEEMGQNLILLDVAGRVKTMTAGARNSLVQLFSDHLIRNQQLPEEIVQWVRDQKALFCKDDVRRALRPLILEQGPKRIKVRFIPDSDRSLLLIEPDLRHTSQASLQDLGLSQREAEILGWVSMGKTNRGISEILGISVRTVEKHVERILEKLGVETRTAAAMIARDSISS